MKRHSSSTGAPLGGLPGQAQTLVMAFKYSTKRAYSFRCFWLRVAG